MVQALGKWGARAALASAFWLGFTASSNAQDDPPSRVARLNYINGNVSMQPAGVDDWAPAIVNRPFTTDDYLYTDQGSRAELHMDIAVLRMGPMTSFGFLNLNDQAVQIKLAEGDMYFRLHNFGPDQTFEVDTPNAAVTLLRDGVYRFRVAPDGSMSFVVVRQGQAEITGCGQAFTLDPGNSATLTGSDPLSFSIDTAPEPDEFDNWCTQRDQHEAQRAAARYLPPTVIGYEDLDDYGDWQEMPDYGPVWYPRSVAVGWAPYHYGHWAWIDPWGWTWVDDLPWGFAPFHYGRWVYIHNRWGWCPGPIAVVERRQPVLRPYYAPALVAWFGGAHWGASVSVGGPSVGWVPLGFGEVFTPSYVCSRRYFTNVNVYNTRIVQTVNITNVYNTVYVNRAVYHREFVNVRAPNAVVAMPQNAFATGRPVREAGIVVRQVDVTRVRTEAVVIAPPVAPTRRAFLPDAGRPAPRPVTQVIQRPVIARREPPPRPAPVAARESFLQQHAGQPFNYHEMHQTIAPQAKPAAVIVRPASAARPVAVHPGEHVGNAPAVMRRPEQPVERPVPVNRGAPPNVRPQPLPNGGSTPVARPNTPAARPNLPERPQPQPRVEPGPQPYERRQSVPQEHREQPHIVPPQQQPAAPPQVHERPPVVQPEHREQPHPAQMQPREQPHIVPPQQQHAAPPQVHERPPVVQPEHREQPHPAQMQPREQPHIAPPQQQHEEHRGNPEHKDDHKDHSH